MEMPRSKISQEILPASSPPVPEKTAEERWNDYWKADLMVRSHKPTERDS